MISLFSIWIAFSISEAGTIYTKTKWQKKDLHVCWAAREDQASICATEYPLDVEDENLSLPSPEMQERVKNWLNSEYTPERTGIHFTGWEKCTPDSQADVFMFYADVEYPRYERGLSSIGNCGMGTVQKPGKAWIFLKLFSGPNTPIQVLKPDGALINPWLTTKALALHEFGHLTGLTHEKDNRDLTIATLEESEMFVTKFDPVSVMNYAWFFQLGRVGGVENVGLSLGDQHSLQCLYTFSEEEKLLKCHKYYTP
ncbi:MAG: hypothetical protein AB7F59_08725 [Bdellovibrionales bacterium]